MSWNTLKELQKEISEINNFSKSEVKDSYVEALLPVLKDRKFSKEEIDDIAHDILNRYNATSFHYGDIENMLAILKIGTRGSLFYHGNRYGKSMSKKEIEKIIIEIEAEILIAIFI